MSHTRQFLTFVFAAIVHVAPAMAADQSITIHGDQGADPSAVATFVTKFEGELHTLDITVEDASVELDVITESPTNGLWQIENTRSNGANFRLADASAHQNHASSFKFRQKSKGGAGGGSGGGRKTYEAISQQIQIFASYPGEPEKEAPRPTQQGDEYYGIVLPNQPEKPVRIRLVYNRSAYDGFDSSSIQLAIANGLKIVNRPADRGVAEIAAELQPGSEVTFDVVHDSVSVPVINEPLPITLTLTDQFGAIHEDEVKLVPVDIVPDWNRDGMINDEDRGKATDENPFAFWINDDDDENEEPHFGDVPGQGKDNADEVVNGERDLVDFFPIQTRIKELLGIFSPTDYSYKILHPNGAFNFIEMPNIQPDSQRDNGAGAYLANAAVAAEAMASPLNKTGGAGAELSIEYLNAVKNGKGILLFESIVATDQSFELIVTKKNNPQSFVRISRALPVLLDDVETMHWRVNIRDAALGKNPGDVIPPANAKFRASRKDRWFVFCHGYNVNAHDARGWSAETFKRLHHMGSNSKFLGVSWEGNQGQLGGQLPFGFVFTPDYWRNSYNAFASSHALKTVVNNLPGNSKSKTVITGHSMGNVIVSSAICDHGLQAEQYFLLNAAVAREAYQSAHIQTDRNDVRHPNWANYPTRLWSSDWHELFDDNDGRKKLTWQGRFGSLKGKTTPHNYYSSTEDVLDNGHGVIPPLFGLLVKDTGAWVKQEMSKGGATKAFVTGLGSDNWTSHGGWAFNPDHYENYRPNPLFPPAEPPDTAPITEAQLRANPFFKPFTKLKDVDQANGGAVVDATNGIDLSGPGGSAHAAEYSIRAWLLSHDVPAISNPAGKNEVKGWTGRPEDSNTDMEDLNPPGAGAWKHSDLKNAHMDIVHKLYERMVKRGKLE